jgi:TP901 family phage tail tape measure protein
MASRILDAEARITARDLSGGAFDSVANKVNRVTRAVQALSRDIDRHMMAAGKASSIDVLASRLDRVGDRAARFGRNMTYGVTLPAAFAARSMLSNLHDFELASNKLKAFGDLSEAEVKRARDVAQKYGSKYAFGPTGVLQGMVEEIKAGFEPRHLEAIQEPLLDFATLAEIEVPKAAELAIYALASFGKMYDKTGDMLDDAQINKNLREMVDLFAILNKIAPGSIAGISETFKYSAPAASKLGVTPEQLGAMTAVLNQAGILGPEAGVALRSMMVRFLKPSRGALAAMNAVGMRLDDYVKVNADLLKPEAILSAVENYTGTIGKGKNKRKVGIGKAPDAARDLFMKRLAALEGLEGEDYVKGLTAVISKTTGGALADTKVAGDLAQRIVGTAVEKIDVMKFLKDAAEKAPNLASFMSLFMDQRQGVRLSNLDQARVLAMLTKMENELTNAREKGVSVSRKQAADVNSGLIDAENRFRGGYGDMIQSLGQSGVTDAAADSMYAVAGAFRAISATNPEILKWSTYAIAAAAVIGPLTWAVGKLVAAAGTIVRVAGAVAAVPGAGVAAGALAGVGAGLAAREAAKPFADAAKGLNWTPRDAAAIKLLEQDLAEADRRAANARRGSKVPGLGDTLAAPFDSQAQDLRNRIQTGYDQFAHSTGRLSEATRDEIMRRAEADVAAAGRKVELDGRVQVESRVTVEPTPDFLTRITSKVSSFFGNGVRSEGTTGPTGTSMPEASPFSP